MTKIITFLTSVLFIMTLHAANVECAKVGRSYYPVSKDAIKLAEHLGVKTCSGKNYKMALKQLGAEMKIVPAPQSLIKKLEDAKAAKVRAKIGSFKF